MSCTHFQTRSIPNSSLHNAGARIVRSSMHSASPLASCRCRPAQTRMKTSPFTSRPPSSINRLPTPSITTTTTTAATGFGNAKTTTPSKKQSSCPCGSGDPYAKCCQVYHDGTLPATPEQLMRSRYAAYSKSLVSYIVDTTHPDNGLAKDDDPSRLESDIRATCDKINWDKLKILSTEDGASEDEGYVTFQTWFKVKGQQGQRAQGWHTQSFIEKSRFLRDSSTGKWLYVDGEQDWDT